ncbi:MAG TPA: NAD(P)-binding domain-containing protein [Thermoanaerobaculia bacterium]|nr:NAD(P)-binding domain-containing protein [Thermoanaerobaculia bacterium]
MRRVAVIGAGPIGIAAAVGAHDRGFEVTLFEKGSVGEALRSWSTTRFFTPLSMNISSSMRSLLGDDAPPDDALLTGAEMIERVLEPIASREPLRGRIRTQTRVTAIGRRGLLRSDYAGHPMRRERPFRIVLNDDEAVEADVVLDATGGYATPNPIGAGGLPAPGEKSLSAIRTLGALSSEVDALHGKRVLLVGDGHSAANALLMLRDARVVWAVRKPNRRPCEEVANDPLPERQRIVAAANDLAEDPPSWLTVERRAVVETIGRSEASLSGNRRVEFDRVAAFTGFHPNGCIHRELTVETSPVTEGSARLYRAIANVTDCLSVPRVTPDDLASGEPDFFFVGSRSYGRAPSFLLQTGLAQLETILDILSV